MDRTILEVEEIGWPIDRIDFRNYSLFGILRAIVGSSSPL